MARRRSVSSMVCCMESVILSAYIMTSPLRFRAARPTVCVSERWLRRKPFLVGVEDGHERYFGEVEALSEEVDADKDIVFAGAEAVENLYAVEGVDVAVDVGRLDFEVEEVVVEPSVMRLVRVVTRVRSLRSMRSWISSRRWSIWFIDGTTRMGGSRRPVGRMTCSDHDALAALELIVGWSGAYEQCLARERLELVEGEGAVVERGREAEAVFHQVLLARAVAAVHGAYLRHRNMAFVDDGDEVLGKIIEKTEAVVALAASVEVARVVLYAGAVAELLYHFHVVGDALFEALGPSSLPCWRKNSICCPRSSCICATAAAWRAGEVTKRLAG